MFSNHAVEGAVFDEGGVARFKLRARLDTEGKAFSTHSLLDGLGPQCALSVTPKDFR